LRKAGSVVTQRKTESSRGNAEIARARKIELRLMREDYLDALEALHDAVWTGKNMNAVMTASDAVTAVKIKMVGKK
ncbi:hypothetical protein IAI25_11220, partial [Streptococcus pseudopneumoniae]|uniref:hypothetical protein n=1 Tax=Streptococcus pseudopneumoniae TaxID=257758 RepID=UPI0018B02FB8